MPLPARRRDSARGGASRRRDDLHPDLRRAWGGNLTLNTGTLALAGMLDHSTGGANEFRQFDVIHEIGLDNVYNARVQVRVVSGDGKITAYGSVVDMVTQDGTYVPGQ
jgi:hypothetical protein